MIHSMRVVAVAVVAVAGTGLAAGLAQADEWPSRPVRILAPATAGGAADTLARLIAEPMSEKYGQRFFIENRPGGGGLIADVATARAEPDGYTLMISSIAYHVIAPAMSANPGIDPVKDFTHIAYIGGPPSVLIVNPTLGATSVPEFVAAARKSPEPLAFVSPGTGTMGHLLGEAFAQDGGFKLQHIPHKGASQALMEMVAGTVKVGFMTWSTALGQIRAGKVVPLAVSSEERVPEFPGVPTLKEVGFPNLVSRTWFGLSGPARLPADIVLKLNRGTIEALDRPLARKRLEQDAMIRIAMTPEDYTNLVISETAKWVPLVKQTAAK